MNRMSQNFAPYSPSEIELILERARRQAACEHPHADVTIRFETRSDSAKIECLRCGKLLTPQEYRVTFLRDAGATP